jgi:acyl-coenzyme A thioesterase PaaI-like protein
MAAKEKQKQPQEIPEENSVLRNTHERIDSELSGDIDELRRGFARVILETIDIMCADDQGLVHGGFIFSAADYAAMLAVNERNVVLAGASSQFLAPVRVGDHVVFEAYERQKEGRKRSVYVKGTVLDIKVFEGEFKTVVTDNHVLNLELLNTANANES